eukprot:SAG22_NODE_653_length_8139_cov_13.407711_2_plen_79_part_00
MVSGGVDCNLCTAFVNQIDVKFRRHVPFPAMAPAKLSQLMQTERAPLMLFQHDSHLDLWRLGSGQPHSEVDLKNTWDR